ncbi:uncharacterized protein EI97DRAFT_53022 [Westerdykella ornata]|uniref:Uncharacterized protein n=1 Tax=Westerdykella ornata TaxID=318751 RepID=A0A6A6JJC2_WESOR|nr:uncharacterized protein EI97DRAFT_53022 [Westerdykella ornata]KAF2276233.1 hypothetical protein EI97DRAFT_53022 [Westerdykella ornata]
MMERIPQRAPHAVDCIVSLDHLPVSTEDGDMGCNPRHPVLLLPLPQEASSFQKGDSETEYVRRRITRRTVSAAQAGSSRWISDSYYHIKVRRRKRAASHLASAGSNRVLPGSGGLLFLAPVTGLFALFRPRRRSEQVTCGFSCGGWRVVEDEHFGIRMGSHAFSGSRGLLGEETKEGTSGKAPLPLPPSRLACLCGKRALNQAFLTLPPCSRPSRSNCAQVMS